MWLDHDKNHIFIVNPSIAIKCNCRNLNTSVVSLVTQVLTSIKNRDDHIIPTHSYFRSWKCKHKLCLISLSLTIFHFIFITSYSLLLYPRYYFYKSRWNEKSEKTNINSIFKIYKNLLKQKKYKNNLVITIIRMIEHKIN